MEAYMVKIFKKTEEEWKKILSPEKYHVLRERGTERPFTGKLLINKKEGKMENAKYTSHLPDPSDYQTSFSSTPKPPARPLLQ